MSLILEVQKDILEDKSITAALRKMMVISYKLNMPELTDWVKSELNGYSYNIENIPEYRQCNAEIIGHLIDPLGREFKNAPIPSTSIEKEHRDKFTVVNIVQSIGSLEDALTSEDGMFRFPIPVDATHVFLAEIKRYPGFACLQAWRNVPRGRIINIIESVKTRLLNFILELESQNPEISNSEKALMEVDRKEATIIYHSTIHGSNNVVAVGSNITQKASIKVKERDIESLKKALKEVGVPEHEVVALEKAIQQEPELLEGNELGSKVQEWVGKVPGKILQGTWALAQAGATEIILKFIFKYYGIDVESF